MSRLIRDITSQDVVFEGDVTFSGSLGFGPAITIDVNADANNLAIPGLSSGVLIRLNFTGNYSLTGIIPPDTLTGWWLIVSNVGGGNSIFKNNDAASAPSNRFLLGSNKTIQSNEGLAIVYDTVDQRWRSFGTQI